MHHKARHNHTTLDLQHSNSHQSYYTCLSRCASAKGTLIIQSLQPSMITGGCSGWLRQEFRDLEILDEITRLAFHSQLVPEINGHCRNRCARCSLANCESKGNFKFQIEQFHD